MFNLNQHAKVPLTRETEVEVYSNIIAEIKQPHDSRIC